MGWDGMGWIDAYHVKLVVVVVVVVYLANVACSLSRFLPFSLFKQTDVPVMNGDTGIPPGEEPHHRPLSSRAPLRCERRRCSAFVVDARSRRDRGVCM
jgi:hypothetical protein